MVLDGSGSVYDDTGWYLVIISWYCLVLVVNGQQRACMPVYIGKSGDLVRCYQFLTHRQTDNKILGYSACLKFKALAESRNDNAKIIKDKVNRIMYLCMA